MTALWPTVLALVLAAAIAGRERRCGGARAEAVARASHELRGPLQAAILGLAAAARPELAANPATRTRLAAVERELLRATLALADLESAHGRPGTNDRVEDLDVVALLAAQVEAWRATAQRDGRPLRFVAAPGVPAVRADGRRIAQATGNLIANALEHGAGAVTVRAHEYGDRVRIEIADEGPGLPAPVQRLVSRRRRPHDARGRGLLIATEAAARNGGRLAAVPAARGCRIVLELPRAVARAA